MNNKKPMVASVIERGSKLVFKPSVEFYETVGIKRKRWGQIYRGEAELLISEVNSLSKYFGIPATDFFN